MKNDLEGFDLDSIKDDDSAYENDLDDLDLIKGNKALLAKDLSPKKNLSHIGHRARVKEEIRKHGINDKYEYLVLEYLLFYVIPRKDTKSIAYDLINRFGNLYGVMNAPAELLEQAKDMTRDASTFLNSLAEISDRYADESGRSTIMSGIDGVLHYLRKIVVPNTEACYIVNINNEDEIISVEKIMEGTNNALDIPVRTIIKTILNSNARRVVILHNHPSGRVEPSKADRAHTYVLDNMLCEMKIELIDHFIVYEKYAFSMKNSKVYKHNWSMR